MAAPRPAPGRPQAAREGSGCEARVPGRRAGPGARGQQDAAAGGTWPPRRPTGRLSLGAAEHVPRQPAPVIGVSRRGFMGFRATHGGGPQAGRRTGARVPAQARGPQAARGARTPGACHGPWAAAVQPRGGQQSPEQDSEQPQSSCFAGDTGLRWQRAPTRVPSLVLSVFRVAGARLSPSVRPLLPSRT